MTPKLSALSVLNNKSQALILRFLWKSRAEWSGREISRQTGLRKRNEITEAFGGSDLRRMRGATNEHTGGL